jgi:hypothetical protein
VPDDRPIDGLDASDERTVDQYPNIAPGADFDGY